MVKFRALRTTASQFSLAYQAQINNFYIVVFMLKTWYCGLLFSIYE